MKLAPAGDFKGIGGVGFFHAKGDISIELFKKTVADMAAGNVFTFLSGKRGIIYHKMHGNGRLADFLERNRRNIIGGAEGVSNVNIRNTGDGNDGADAGLFYVHLIQTVKFVQLAYLDFFLFFRVMGVAEHNFLIDGNAPVVHFSHADASHVFVIVDGTD